MSNDREIVYLRGTLYWAKILGDPVLNYGKDAKEWTMDVSVDADGKAQVKSLGILSKLKNKDDERGDFLTLKQRELKRDGTPAYPIKVMDAAGKKWDPEKKLGNGTKADVKFELVDYGKDKAPTARWGLYPRAVRILEHSEYAAQEFPPMSEDDEFFSKAQETEQNFKVDDTEFRKDFGLETDDDVSFA